MEAIYIWHPIKVNHALSELCGFNIYLQHGVFLAQFFFQNIIIETFEFDVQLTQLTFCPAIPRICQWHSNLIMWLELQCGFYIYSLHETFQFGLFQIIVNIINTDYHYQKIFKTKFDIQSHIQWYWLSINIII